MVSVTGVGSCSGRSSSVEAGTHSSCLRTVDESTAPPPRRASTPPMMVIMPLVIELRKRRRVGSSLEICSGTLVSSAEGISYRHSRGQRPRWEWRKVAMLRRTLLVARLAVAAIPIAAQGPAGWKVRPDETNATLGVMPTEKGFQLAGGPGIFFNPANAVKPIYRVRATFTQLKAPAKKTYYGLFFGGNQLDAAPEYAYFGIGQDGSFLIRHRAGTQVDEMDTSLHYAIKKPDASGKVVNTLEVQVAPTAVSYLVNGAVVDATPTRSAVAGNSFTVTEKIGGFVGVRIDDPIDVQVDGFFFESPFRLNERGQ